MLSVLPDRSVLSVRVEHFTPRPNLFTALLSTFLTEKCYFCREMPTMNESHKATRCDYQN